MAEAPRLPSILASRPTADGVELDLFIPAGLFWFQGHFPGMPVLPGVVQIDWVVDFAHRYLGVEAGAGTRLRAKFRAVIVPSDTVTLALGRRADGASVHFEYRRAGEVCSSGAVTVTS